MIESIFQKECLVFGCGNPLFGDDGFGPAVVHYLKSHYDIPKRVACLDVGTSIQNLLFDILLAREKPKLIVIVDAIDSTNGTPGEILEISTDQISPAKLTDFCVHQFPSINMLKEIEDSAQIELKILAVRSERIPSQVQVGLSAPVKASIPRMCEKILEIITGKKV